MQVVLYLAGFIVLLFILIAVFSVNSPEVSPTEEAANDIMDEVLQAEAPQPPPADLFVREEDLIEVQEPVKVGDLNFLPSEGLVAMDNKPMQEPVQEQKPTPEVKEPVKKKRKHYPSKPKNKKS
jgi:outer membrane biosynthesis protein TonB